MSSRNPRHSTTTSSRTFSSEDTEITTQIQKNFDEVQLAIKTVATSVGRDPDDVMLVAVSKTVGLPEIKEAIEAGVHDFGENRAKVFLEKQQALQNEHWHFIGRIQTNKLKDLVGRASLIHSVATERALEAINTLALKRQIIQRVLIEVNVSGELSKDGISANELVSLLESALLLKGVAVEGLMTMAPIARFEGDDTARKTFSALRELRDNLVPIFKGAANIRLNELSMGMSDDFAVAIQEGATIVRIGRKLWS